MKGDFKWKVVPISENQELDIRTENLSNNIICVSGGMDCTHIGHIKMFREASKLGSVIVLLNSDEWLTRKKGKPFMNWNERAEILREMKSISRVIAFDDKDGTACEGLKKVTELFPEAKIAFANGGDRVEKTTPEVLYCEKHNIELLWNVGGTKTQSSSDLIHKFYNQSQERSWGLWTVLKQYSTVKIKELIVRPGEKLSLQRHKFRSEFWFVRSGIATIRFEYKDTFSKERYETIFIEKNRWHQLRNNEKEVLYVIEIQYGDLCIESDIERYKI